MADLQLIVSKKAIPENHSLIQKCLIIEYEEHFSPSSQQQLPTSSVREETINLFESQAKLYAAPKKGKESVFNAYTLHNT